MLTILKMLIVYTSIAIIANNYYLYNTKYINIDISYIYIYIIAISYYL